VKRSFWTAPVGGTFGGERTYQLPLRKGPKTVQSGPTHDSWNRHEWRISGDDDLMLLGCQFRHQRPGPNKVGHVEPLGEPIMNRGDEVQCVGSSPQCRP
jgi:hypothetical protein